jgi:hypothetical protein
MSLVLGGSCGRTQETKKIKEACLDRDREQEVLAQLLHKETKLLQTIDRLKINANHENKDLRIQHTLGKMSQVCWGRALGLADAGECTQEHAHTRCSCCAYH